MTNPQKKELEVLQYFMPQVLKHIIITDRDIGKYFDWSERGLHRGEIKDSHFYDGFNALVSAKQWAGRHIGMFEEGVLDGSVPYVTLLEDMPESVVGFIGKEMFKGIDTVQIRKVYNSINI